MQEDILNLNPANPSDKEIETYLESRRLFDIPRSFLFRSLFHELPITSAAIPP
jgi:hypothetical protein